MLAKTQPKDQLFLHPALSPPLTLLFYSTTLALMCTWEGAA